MAGTIATLLANSAVIAQTGDDTRGDQRHAYNELVAAQAEGDPALASPYLKASGQSTVAANGGTSGSMTITINFPKQAVAVTTANVAYNANEAAIQSAIDTAMSGETVISSYTNGHIDAGTCANFASANCAVTANGASVNGAYMVITTANVDLDVAAPAVTVNTVGTQNRPAEAVLKQYGVITPDSSVTAQGLTPSDGDYVRGDNPLSFSPALQNLLVRSVQTEEDATLGAFLRAIPDNVANPDSR